MARTWFDIKAQADETVEVSIFDEIGYWGVTAKDFIDGIKPHKGKPLALSINSLGGDVFAGIAMFNALRNHGGEITVRVLGVAASAASLVAMAGDKIKMPRNSFMMVHNPWMFAAGNADELRDAADVLDKIGNALAGTYASRTGKTVEEVRKMLSEDTWLTAEEAVEAGFADEVEEDLKAAAAVFDIERLPENVRTVFNSANPKSSASPEPEDDETDDGDGFAENYARQIDAAGLSEYKATMVLAATDEASGRAEIARVREIVALCKLTDKESAIAAFVADSTPLADVRKRLVQMRATADENSHTDNARRQATNPAASGNKAAVKPADIWATRKAAIVN
jgi:ATP-dependent Clp protease, protease subunit